MGVSGFGQRTVGLGIGAFPKGAKVSTAMFARVAALWRAGNASKRRLVLGIL